MANFPHHKLGLKVELLIGTTWTDITAFVRTSDPVSISPFGRVNEASGMQPAQLALKLDNRTGRFTPGNSLGAYFPFVQLNTRIRVSVSDTSASGAAYSGFRFHGEVSSWPAAWNENGSDVYAQVTASGIWRRLSQSTKTLGSPYTRYNNINVRAAWTLASYWPMEDGQDSATLANLVAGQAAMTSVFADRVNLASCTAFPGSDAIPVLNAAELSGVISTAVSPSNILWRFNLFVPSGGDTGIAAGTVARLHLAASGTIGTIDVNLGPAGGGPMEIFGFNQAGSQVFHGSSTLSTFGIPLEVQVGLAQVGTSITWSLRTMLPGGTTANSTVTGSISGTVKDATQVIFSPGATWKGTAVGQSVVIYGNPDITDSAQALAGWNGEDAAARFLRVCAEQGIPAVLTGSATSGTAMGPQADDTLSKVLEMIEATDGGLLFETRDQFGLGYRPRASLTNQSPVLSLDYAARQLSSPLMPASDDTLTRNDVTLTNHDGYAVRAFLAAGARSIQDPPNGVGSGYEYTANVSSDDHAQVDALAEHLLGLGTVADSRYPTVTVNLAAPGTAPLFSAVPATVAGDYLTIANLPPYGGPATQKQLIWGWTETLSDFEWTFTFNTVPEAPWESGFVPGTTVTGQVPGSPVTLSQAGSVSGGQIAESAISLFNLAQEVLTFQFGGITSTISSVAPANPSDGNLWFDQGNGFQIKRWDAAGGSWVPVVFDGENILGAGTITAGLLAANAVVAGTVAAGAIDGQVINGAVINGAIVNSTSGGMFVYQAGGSVLNLNPNFTSGITNWTAVTGGISYTTPTLNGHNTMQLAITHSTAPGLWSGGVTSEFENVTAGNSYFVTFIVQLSAVTTGGGLQVNWFDSGNVLIAQDQVATPTGTVSTWTTYSGVVTAPASAVKMQLVITGRSNVNTAFINVGQAQIATNPTLVASVAPMPGTDAFGHSFKAGLWVYDTGGNSIGLVGGGGGAASQLALSVGAGTPTPVSGTAALYGAGSGAVQVVDGTDGQAYSTQRLSRVSGSDQTVSSGTFANIFNSTVVAAASGGGSRFYRVSGFLHLLPQGTSGKAAFRWLAPSGVSGNVNYEFTGISGNTATPYSQTNVFETGGLNNNASTSAFITLTLTGNAGDGSVETVRFDGAFSVPSGVSGAFSLQAATTGSPYIVRAFSYMDIMPV